MIAVNCKGDASQYPEEHSLKAWCKIFGWKEPTTGQLVRLSRKFSKENYPRRDFSGRDEGFRMEHTYLYHIDVMLSALNQFPEWFEEIKSE